MLLTEEEVRLQEEGRPLEKWEAGVPRSTIVHPGSAICGTQATNLQIAMFPRHKQIRMLKKANKYPLSIYFTTQTFPSRLSSGADTLLGDRDGAD